MFLDYEKARNCSLCSAGHSKRCTCEENCGHAECRGKRDARKGK